MLNYIYLVRKSSVGGIIFYFFCAFITNKLSSIIINHMYIVGFYVFPPVVTRVANQPTFPLIGHTLEI